MLENPTTKFSKTVYVAEYIMHDINYVTYVGPRGCVSRKEDTKGTIRKWRTDNTKTKIWRTEKPHSLSYLQFSSTRISKTSVVLATVCWPLDLYIYFFGAHALFVSPLKAHFQYHLIDLLSDILLITVTLCCRMIINNTSWQSSINCLSRKLLVQHMLCCVVVVFSFVFVLCFVYPMLPVSLDCPFLVPLCFL